MIRVHPVLSNGRGNIDPSQVTVQRRTDGWVEVKIPLPHDGMSTVLMEEPKEDVILFHGSDSEWRPFPSKEVTHYFKPHGHWNVITKEVYDVLVRFYGPDMLRTECKSVR